MHLYISDDMTKQGRNRATHISNDMTKSERRRAIYMLKLYWATYTYAHISQKYQNIASTVGVGRATIVKWIDTPEWKRALLFWHNTDKIGTPYKHDPALVDQKRTTDLLNETCKDWERLVSSEGHFDKSFILTSHNSYPCDKINPLFDLATDPDTDHTVPFSNILGKCPRPVRSWAYGVIRLYHRIRRFCRFCR